MRETASTVSNLPSTSPAERPADSPRRPRRGLVVTAVAVAVCLVAAIGFVVVAITSDDDGSSATTHQDHGTDDAGTGDAAAGHEGHDTQVLAGCDAEAYHNTMMMFDPLAADGLVDSGCTWPYDATIVVEGGTEDPSIDEPFEPQRYADVFDVIGTERYGMCSVASLADPHVNGFVFGFGVALNPSGCAGGDATVQLVIREYASRAWRDTAAVTAAGAGGTEHIVVLGRWVMTIAGTDADGAARLVEALAPLGGVELTA